ncbi:glycosyltransferase family 2 protein [candidate division CSSED10-310 bacterium]|uniref:Glycosyltransferase family 2 protein n=1 Tax=candidate division CSSED10-310 bacterium TaxID=2855610 RepID=A0ABV6YWC2_UNCC1
MQKKCIIIPAFNEAENIGAVIAGIRKNSDADLIVIDDGSTDSTVLKSRHDGVIVISHPFNMGYGVALQTGYKYAVRHGYDYLVQMDGDGQHNPHFLPELVKPIETQECDVVIGSRYMRQGDYKAGFLKSSGVKFFRFLIWLINRQRITDPTSGFQCLNKKVFTFYTADSFPCDYPDTNIIIVLHRMGFRVKEIPVSMVQNPSGRRMHQGIFTILYYLFKMILSIFIVLIREKSYYSVKEIDQ